MLRRAAARSNAAPFTAPPCPCRRAVTSSQRTFQNVRLPCAHPSAPALTPQAATYQFNPESDCLATAFANKVNTSFLGGVQMLRTGDILQARLGGRLR